MGMGIATSPVMSSVNAPHRSDTLCVVNHDNLNLEPYDQSTLEDALENASENVRMAARNIAAVLKVGQAF